MIDEKEKTKSIEKAFEILKDIRKDISQTDRLIRLLEDVKKIKQYYNDQYEQFCQIYLVMLLEDKISDQLNREIMYVAYGLLQGFENDKTIKDRHRLYAQKAYGINTYIKQWKNPDDSLSKHENKHIINKLAEDLIEDALANEQSKGILGFADEVIKNLSERFPEGIPLALPLPEPKFVKKDRRQKGCQRTQGKINDAFDENLKKVSADNLQGDIGTDNPKEKNLSGGSASNDEDDEKEPKKEKQHTQKIIDNRSAKTTYIREGDKVKPYIDSSTSTKTVNVAIVVDDSTRSTGKEKTSGKQKLLNRHIGLRTMFVAIAVAAFCIGGGILTWGYFREKRNNKELLAQIASLNSNGKERDSVIATSIEVENKNIYLAPGGYEYLVVKATPPEVDILFDLNYTSEPKGIVTIDKDRDDSYARVMALLVREEDMCDKVTITIQGSGTAEAKAYVFIKNTDSKGISAGNNIDSD